MYLPINLINNCKSTVEKLLQEENRKPAAFYHLIDLRKIKWVISFLSRQIQSVSRHKHVELLMFCFAVRDYTSQVYVEICRVTIQSLTILVESLDYNVERFLCSCQNGNMERLVLSSQSSYIANLDQSRLQLDGNSRSIFPF